MRSAGRAWSNPNEGDDVCTRDLKTCCVVSVVLAATLILTFVAGVHAEDEYWVPKDPPKSLYTVDARFDIEGGLLQGSEEIVFTNNSAGPIGVLALSWLLDDDSSLEISIDGDAPALLNAENGVPSSSPLFYRLPRPVAPGGKAVLKIKFSRKWKIAANETEIVTSGWWYPRLWWDGLRFHDSFRMKLAVPEGWTMALGGRLNPESGYYENEGGRTCGFYLGKGMKTLSREVEGVLITSIFREAEERTARVCFETAVDAIAFYKQRFGFYPFRFLYIVPGVPGRPMGGYPVATGIVVIHGLDAFEKRDLLHWQWITAHEIGHQYWSEWVLDPDDPSWLWIGMGIFADREYMKARGLSSAKHEGLIQTYIDGVMKHYDTTMDIPPAQADRIEYDWNNVTVHGKGFSLVSALDAALGRETFDRIYRRCLHDYGGKRLGWHEFRRVCEEESGENLGWFFEQWVRSGKFLSCKVESQECVAEGGSFVSTVVVHNKLETIMMPVEVKAIFTDGSSQVKRTSRSFERNVLRFESASPLADVVIDPEKKLPLVAEPPSRTAAEMDAIVGAMGWSVEGEKALEVYGLAMGSEITSALTWLKLGILLYDGGHYTEALDCFTRIPSLEASDLYKFAAYTWMGHLKDLLGEREAALGFYRKALEYERGDGMQHSQYGIMLNRAWVEERLKTPFKRER
jgi:hypothetical protein